MREVAKILLFPLLLVSACNVAIADTPPGNRNSPTVLGVILPLTGEASSLGIAIKNGIEMGLDSLPSDKRDRIQVVFEDDSLQAKNSISAFNKLLSQNKADVILNFSSGTAHAIAPLAEREKLPFAAIASDAKIVKDRNYSVLFWVTPEAEAAVTVPEALRRGYKRIARILTTQEGVLAAKNAFDTVNAGKIQILVDEEYPADVRDFRTFIAKLRTVEKLDAVMPILLPGQCGVFAKQLRSSGVNLPLFSIEMFGDESEVKAANGALTGGWYAINEDDDKVFLDRYKKAYPGASTFASSNGHDFILMLSEAISKDPSREGINHFLHNVKNFTGALGTFSASGDNRFTLPATIKVVG